MLKAILTEANSIAGNKRFNVGVAGTAPSGLKVYRPHYLIRGPWCITTARQKANTLQSELNKNLHGSLLGWLKKGDN